MTQTFEAVYDGTSLHPDKPLTFKPNTRLRIMAESDVSRQWTEAELDAEYALMAADKERETEALAWAEATIGETRAKFATFEDWNDSEMDAYDNYDESLAALQARRRSS